MGRKVQNLLFADEKATGPPRGPGRIVFKRKGTCCSPNRAGRPSPRSHAGGGEQRLVDQGAEQLIGGLTVLHVAPPPALDDGAQLAGTKPEALGQALLGEPPQAREVASRPGAGGGDRFDPAPEL